VIHTFATREKRKSRKTGDIIERERNSTRKCQEKEHGNRRRKKER
jgi:hypothetical protein